MKKKAPAVAHDDYLNLALKDPRLAAAYLNEAIRDNNKGILLMALRHVARAHGIVSIARTLHTHRESVDRMLSNRGNPALTNFLKILDASGIVLQFKIKQAD